MMRITDPQRVGLPEDRMERRPIMIGLDIRQLALQPDSTARAAEAMRVAARPDDPKPSDAVESRELEMENVMAILV
jgi:hypothetical protein